MRIEVFVESNLGVGPYWVDSNGFVWNHPEDGQRWKNAAHRIGPSYWQYSRQSGPPLYLRAVVPSVESPAVEPPVKPPLGLRPDYVAVAEYDRKRCKEIGEAILRYASALYPVPQEWIDELNELIERNQPEDPEV